MRITITTPSGTVLCERIISAQECAALRNDLPGEKGITDWVLAMIDGKIKNCAKRAATQARAFFMTKQLPSSGLSDLSDLELVRAMTEHEDYKDRAQRDEDALDKVEPLR